MYRIITKERLAGDIYRFDIEAPLIARKAMPGQFVVVRIDEKGERIPLTIADSDEKRGTISLVAMRVGKTTCMLSMLKEGDKVIDLVGPLGRESEIEHFGKVVCVGGGVGTAPILPIAKALKEKKNDVISIIGAKNKDSHILLEEIGKTSDELIICTDDGSYGFEGFVSMALLGYLETDEMPDRVIAIGPVPMMKAVSDVTRAKDIKTIVSLNSIMVDATGMCGTCRVEVAGKTRFACVDGPDFDGHEVDFELLMTRQKMYLDEEKKAMEEYQKECKCRLEDHIL